jgi:hypothetical protein
LPAMPDVRVRHVAKDGAHYYIVFNEGQKDLAFKLRTLAEGRRFSLDAETGRQTEIDPHGLLQMQAHELKVFTIKSA